MRYILLLIFLAGCYNKAPELLPLSAESDFVIDHDTLFQFYNTTDARRLVVVRYSVDEGRTWSASGLTGLYIMFPDIELYKGHYYATGTNKEETAVYLLRSSDRLHWDTLNVKKPIFQAVKDSTDWRYRYFNVSHVIVNDTIHYLAEGSGKQDKLGGYYATGPFMGYAKAPLSTPAVQLPDRPQIKGGNAKLLATGDTLVCLFGYYTGTFPVYSMPWEIHVGYVPCNQASDSSAWRFIKPSWALGNAADPSIAFFKNKAILYYEVDQGAGGKQYYLPISSPKDLLRAK